MSNSPNLTISSLPSTPNGEFESIPNTPETQSENNDLSLSTNGTVIFNWVDLGPKPKCARNLLNEFNSVANKQNK